MSFVANLILSSAVISFCVWLAGKRPELAGFILSLPLSTLLVLGLTQFEHGDSQKTVLLAKSVFVALPATLVFFIPFLLSERLRIPFWLCYFSGIALLAAAFLVHRYVMSLLS